MTAEKYSFDKGNPTSFHRRYDRKKWTKVYPKLTSEMCPECYSDLKNHSIRNRRKCEAK